MQIKSFFTDEITQSEHTFLTNGIVTHENSMFIQISDLQILSKNRLKYPTNPLFGCLDRNSLRNKTNDVREVIGKLLLD